jgi:hypothetical protein
VVAGVLALSAFSPTASGQEQTEPHKAYFKTIPLRGNTPEQAARESANGSTILTWTYSATSPRDGNFYTGQIMGAQWLTALPSNPPTETIPTYLVPLILNIWDGTKWVKFDPTATDNTCAGGNVPRALVENSPLFQHSQFIWNGVNLGTTQYIDALQRASFWTLGSSGFFGKFYEAWHNYFGLHTTLPITVNVPTQTGPMVQNAPCGQIGIISLAWLDLYVTSNIIPSLKNLGVNPTAFPIILTYNVVQRDDATGTCCILGYHSAYGSPAQVYAVSMFDTTGDFRNSQDITALSHELGETMNDPFAINATPTWGNEGQDLGVCAAPPFLEVGDPLTGTLYPPITLHSYTYHPQELAMAGWFLDGWLPTLNWGIPGWFSSNGTFFGPACTCPPGGHHFLLTCGP